MALPLCVVRIELLKNSRLIEYGCMMLAVVGLDNVIQVFDLTVYCLLKIFSLIFELSDGFSIYLCRGEKQDSRLPNMQKRDKKKQSGPNSQARISRRWSLLPQRK